MVVACPTRASPSRMDDGSRSFLQSMHSSACSNGAFVSMDVEKDELRPFENMSRQEKVREETLRTCQFVKFEQLKATEHS